MKEKKTSKTKTSVFFGFLRRFTSFVFRKTPHTLVKRRSKTKVVSEEATYNKRERK